MLKLSKILALSLAVAITSIVSGSNYCLAQEATDANLITVDSIDKENVLVGALGKPLGTAMKITGKWHYPPSPDRRTILCDSRSHPSMAIL